MTTSEIVFSVGDTVCLRSLRNIEMTVVDADGLISCAYYNHISGKIEFVNLAAQSLVLLSGVDE